MEGTANISVTQIENLSKVTNFRRRFESPKHNESTRFNFATDSENKFESDKRFAKLDKPKKSVLLRSQTMRVPSLLHHREGLVVRNAIEPAGTSVSRHSSESSETVYENIQPEANAGGKALGNHHYENVKPTTQFSSRKSSLCRSHSQLIKKSLKFSCTSEINIDDPPKVQEKTNIRPLITELKKVLRRNDSESSIESIAGNKILLQNSVQRDSVSSFGSEEDHYEDISPIPSPQRPNSITTEPLKTPKVYKIIEELLQNEKTYIDTLQIGVEDYITKFDELESLRKIPNSLKCQKSHIFSNIEKIHDFHRTKFYPKLLMCGLDPEKIASAFKGSIDDGMFDKYVIYVVNKKRSEKICKDNDYFFRQIQKDSLGISSFLLQPIQRLPKYQLLLGEIAKELLKDLDGNKNAIAAVCVAEKGIQKLLGTVNEYCR